jgi:transcriptional regulator with PAS, ATPase and Fis domain
MVKKKKFREDLWFRLNVFPIQIPPLRERKIDIPALVQYLIEKKAGELKLTKIPEVLPGAVDHLLEYNWPGNVRELQNLVERELILNPNGPLQFKNFLVPKADNSIEKVPKEAMTHVKLDDVVAHHIQNVLDQTEGKIHGKGGAADLLGINASTLRNRMNKLGINYKKRSF